MYVRLVWTNNFHAIRQWHPGMVEKRSDKTKWSSSCLEKSLTNQHFVLMKTYTKLIATNKAQVNWFPARLGNYQLLTTYYSTTTYHNC